MKIFANFYKLKKSIEPSQLLLNHKFQILNLNLLTSCLGVANRRIIKDEAITASSYRGHLYRPANGRLNMPWRYGYSSGAWCGHNVGDWIQVDLGQEYTVTKVSLQGRLVFCIAMFFGLRQYLANESSLKNDEKCFLFHLKYSFRSQNI